MDNGSFDESDLTTAPHMTANGAGSTATIKHSYTVPCSSAFRDAAETLAGKRQVNVGDIARSVLLALPPELIAVYPDPGEPSAEDRETVILKSGPAMGRPWRRKPRLQVRMAPGFEVVTIRRALALALAIDRCEIKVRLDDPRQQRAPEPPPPPVTSPDHTRALEAVTEELERLKAAVAVLSFQPLPAGVNSRAEALHVLGFPPNSCPDRRMIRARFRMLATIHHPDSNFGDHERMSQLNQAMEHLRDVG